MKICLFAVSNAVLGKHNVKDPRLDQADRVAEAKKKTYVQVDLLNEDHIGEADATLVSTDARAELILKDWEFVETRLSRQPTETELALLNRLKVALEKEEFLFQQSLSPEERQTVASYGLLTAKPVVAADAAALENLDALLLQLLHQCGFICFLTVGGKENRAWQIRKGATAWEAAGVIHSDIQKGFIRAEIISFQDLIQAGGETQAKRAGKMRLETKDYVMQDCDITNFRFNK
jgi:ribosome-binding ATPase YchF (GTP1/OBG family)